MTIHFEHTDTFGGESNYSWVRRLELSPTQLSERGVRNAQSERSLVRAAKSWAHLTGVPCRVERFGDMLAIYPRGICHVVFITWS